MGDKDIPADGVVTGYGRNRRAHGFCIRSGLYRPGRVSGRDARGQGILQNHGHGSGGGLPRGGPVRLRRRPHSEAVDALSGYGQIFYRNACSSGRIPQISVIMGPCAGSAIFPRPDGPDCHGGKGESDVYHRSRGGSGHHGQGRSLRRIWAERIPIPLCQEWRTFPRAAEEEALGAVRCLLSYLPSKAGARPPLMDFTEHEELQPLLDTVIPDDSSLPYDMHDVVRILLDGAQRNGVAALLCRQHYHLLRPPGRAQRGRNCQSALLYGRKPGHQRFGQGRPLHPALRCLRNSTDQPGGCTGLPARRRPGARRHHPPRSQAALCLLGGGGAPARAVVLRKAYGGSYLAMCSKDLGADFVYAWPTAEIAVMGAAGAANVVFRKEIQQRDPKAARREKIQLFIPSSLPRHIWRPPAASWIWSSAPRRPAAAGGAGAA